MWNIRNKAEVDRDHGLLVSFVGALGWGVWVKYWRGIKKYKLKIRKHNIIFYHNGLNLETITEED